jgi:hypothetical protein
MNNTYLFLTVVVLLMSWMMGSIFFNESYVCPTCGTTDQDRHAEECPWKH